MQGRTSSAPALKAVAAAVSVAIAGVALTGCASGHSSTKSSGTVVAAGAPIQPGYDVLTTTTDAVAPLRHVVQPNLMVTTARTMSQTTVVRLRRAVHGRSAVAVDIGMVRANGHTVRAIGVDLSAFRGYTPPPTAASDQLWANLAAGDVAVSYSLAQRAGFRPSQQIRVGQRTMRVGAIADFGLPKVGILVARANDTGLGLHPRAGALVSAPGHSAATLAANARDVLGARAHIVPVGPDAAAPDTGKPRTYIELYKAGARSCSGLSWTILAAIGQVESGHGRNVGPSSAGALGPMQFMPATWAQWGFDGDGDRKADIMDPYDAVYAAAHYLCWYHPGASLANLRRAIFAYNHADWYVNEVLAVARLYG